MSLDSFSENLPMDSDAAPHTTTGSLAQTSEKSDVAAECPGTY